MVTELTSQIVCVCVIWKENERQRERDSAFCMCRAATNAKCSAIAFSQKENYSFDLMENLVECLSYLNGNVRMKFVRFFGIGQIIWFEFSVNIF